MDKRNKGNIKKIAAWVLVYTVNMFMSLFNLAFKYIIGSFVTLALYFLLGYGLGLIVKYTFGEIFVAGLSAIINTNITIDKVPIALGVVCVLGVMFNLRSFIVNNSEE